MFCSECYSLYLYCGFLKLLFSLWFLVVNEDDDFLVVCKIDFFTFFYGDFNLLHHIDRFYED